MNTKKALILAAGKGERLVKGKPYPKPLEKVAGTPLIVRVLRNLEAAGIQEVGIIVGYLGDILKAELLKFEFSMVLRFIENDEFEKPNGTSLLKAKTFVDQTTFLMMSDHLWSPSLLARVDAFDLKEDEALLGIDQNIDACFDLDDATKVLFEGDQIQEISKTLPNYNALDTGVFRITPRFMDVLASAETEKGCSLSEGVFKMAAARKMKVADVGDAIWIDVDTPEAHAQAEKLIHNLGDDISR